MSFLPLKPPGSYHPKAHPYDLTRIPTRQLMGFLEKARQCGSGWDPTGNHGPMIPIEELREELAQREHVPNKIEARRLRQQRARNRISKESL